MLVQRRRQTAGRAVRCAAIERAKTVAHTWVCLREAASGKDGQTKQLQAKGLRGTETTIFAVWTIRTCFDRRLVVRWYQACAPRSLHQSLSFALSPLCATRQEGEISERQKTRKIDYLAAEEIFQVINLTLSIALAAFVCVLLGFNETVVDECGAAGCAAAAIDKLCWVRPDWAAASAFCALLRKKFWFSANLLQAERLSSDPDP